MIQVRVKGTSGRHYEVKAKQQLPHPGLSENSNRRRKTWSTSVIGAAWKKDIESKNSNFTASLCLNISEQKTHLPIGDKLASLALSLRNDIELAMDIALVAQFIICPRNRLEHIFTFQDEMIVTQDMIDMNDEDEEEMDWEEEEEYFNSLQIMDLEGDIVDFEHNIDQVEEDLFPDLNRAEDLVDHLVRAFDVREDQRTRGSS
ncbi:hypothetical protein N9M06_02500 [Candidatus Poseidoniales archaeon]|nr:hypothetical protein [Candidatus Poseidoniales archaeon]MDB2333843.1 hypothetical protein [Candidatus Poseidoniales archaeon]